jgi:hypothetical protein
MNEANGTRYIQQSLTLIVLFGYFIYYLLAFVDCLARDKLWIFYLQVS